MKYVIIYTKIKIEQEDLKQMKKIVFAIMLIFVTFVFSGCGTTESSENSSSSNQIQNMTKHEIALTLDNYLSFFDVQTSIVNGQSPYKFTGCLNYAFYDNVAVYVEYTTSYSYGDPTKETVVVKLNSAGKGNAPVKNGNQTAELVAISGTVVFWL